MGVTLLVELQSQKKGARQGSITCTSEWGRGECSNRSSFRGVGVRILRQKRESICVNLELMRSKLRLKDGYVRHLDNATLSAVWDAQCKVWKSP